MYLVSIISLLTTLSYLGCSTSTDLPQPHRNSRRTRLQPRDNADDLRNYDEGLVDHVLDLEHKQFQLERLLQSQPDVATYQGRDKSTSNGDTTMIRYTEVMISQIVAGADIQEDFHQENILPVLDSGAKTDVQTPYGAVAYEDLGGRDLQYWIDGGSSLLDSPIKGDNVDATNAAISSIFDQMARAVNELHSKNVKHLDLRP
jgi:serine/threonine protein kinase